MIDLIKAEVNSEEKTMSSNTNYHDSLERVVRRGPRKGKRKTPSRRMKSSDLWRLVPKHYEVPTSSGIVTDSEGQAIHMNDPIGTVVDYLNKDLKVVSKQDVLQVEVGGRMVDRSYIEVPYKGTTVQFRRR